MIQRFCYLADTVVEVVIDGDSVTWNVLPAISVPPPSVEPSEAGPESPLVAAPLELCAAAPAPTKKKRTLMGVIRAGWFVIFTAAGEAFTYGLNNLTSLNLPPGTATAIGAVGYGVKKALWPSTQL